MKAAELIADLSKRIEARHAGATLGYGESHSLDIILDVEVGGYLREWSLLLEAGDDTLTEEEHAQTAEICRLAAEARELYGL